jgi:uncharacterized RDD family membrane protein YckC
VVAYLLDAILSGLIGYLVFAIAGLALGILGFGPISPGESVGFFIFVVVDAVYHVSSWRSAFQATPGQRLLSIRVGKAFDGNVLSVSQAVRRWIALGWFISVFDALPMQSSIVSLAVAAWWVVLLATTIANPANQGLHDRFANSVLVRPSEARPVGAAAACAIYIGVVLLLAVIGIVAYILLGSDILSRVGDSI